MSQLVRGDLTPSHPPPSHLPPLIDVDYSKFYEELLGLLSEIEEILPDGNNQKIHDILERLMVRSTAVNTRFSFYSGPRPMTVSTKFNKQSFRASRMPSCCVRCSRLKSIWRVLFASPLWVTVAGHSGMFIKGRGMNKR